jgi:hypothetical protein
MGNQLHYDYGRRNPYDLDYKRSEYTDRQWDRVLDKVNQLVWKDNYEFRTTMTFIDYVRGRSAAYWLLSDDDDLHYTMFMKDMRDLVQNATIVKGSVSGLWTFVKRGMNYGVCYIPEEQAIL